MVLAQPINATVETIPCGANLAQVQALLRTDPEFFIQFFMADALTVPVPALHVEIFLALTDLSQPRVAIAIPRGYAKTTLAKLAITWLFLFSDYRYILYVSGTEPLVVPYVNDIIAFLECDNFANVFGPLEWLTRRKGEGFFEFRIPTLSKYCILEGLGAGSRIRGKNVKNLRPDAAFGDDLEDIESVTSEAYCRSLSDWWYSDFLKALNQFRSSVRVLGNLINKDGSLFYEILHSSHYMSIIYGCIRADGTPLWPEMHDIEFLRRDYLRFQMQGKADKWFAEMMNQPVATGGGIIRASEIRYLPQATPQDCLYTCITIDPAISAERWADKSAIAVHGFLPEYNKWQIVASFQQRGVDPTMLFHIVIQLAAHWHTRVIGIETAAMQGAMLVLFEQLAAVHNLPQYHFVPLLYGGKRKAERIIAWASRLRLPPPQAPDTANAVTLSLPRDAATQWALPAGDFTVTQQLLTYAPANRNNDDNLIDCCAYGPQIVSKHIQLIAQTSQPEDERGALIIPLAAYATC